MPDRSLLASSGGQVVPLGEITAQGDNLESLRLESCFEHTLSCARLSSQVLLHQSYAHYACQCPLEAGPGPAACLGIASLYSLTVSASSQGCALAVPCEPPMGLGIGSAGELGPRAGTAWGQESLGFGAFLP